MGFVQTPQVLRPFVPAGTGLGGDAAPATELGHCGLDRPSRPDQRGVCRPSLWRAEHDR